MSQNLEYYNEKYKLHSSSSESINDIDSDEEK